MQRQLTMNNYAQKNLSEFSTNMHRRQHKYWVEESETAVFLEFVFINRMSTRVKPRSQNYKAHS